MKAYKGFYKDSDGRIFCQPNDDVKFYYEEGKTYETDKAKLCKCGFHACTLPIGVFWHYDSYNREVEFHEVELEGATDERVIDSKVCGTKITIGRKITLDEMVDLSIQMIMSDKEKYFNDGNPYIIKKDNKHNFINTDGKIISDEWFDDVFSFCDNFARVYIDSKGWNYINTGGDIICDDWFDAVWNFNEGFARVRISDKGWNLIREDGKILRDDLWFDDVWIFNEGLAMVRLNNKFNFINTDGNIISDVWFDIVGDFDEGFARVYISDKGWNFIDTDGNILRDDLWFDAVWNFRGGFADVIIKGGWYRINTKGEIIS